MTADLIYLKQHNMAYRGKECFNPLNGSRASAGKTVSKLTVQLGRSTRNVATSGPQDTRPINQRKKVGFGINQSSGLGGDIDVTGSSSNFQPVAPKLGNNYPADRGCSWGGAEGGSGSQSQEGGLIMPLGDHERCVNEQGSCQTVSIATDNMNAMSVNNLLPALDQGPAAPFPESSVMYPDIETNGLHPLVLNGNSVHEGDSGSINCSNVSKLQFKEPTIMNVDPSPLSAEEKARALAVGAIEQALASQLVLSVTKAAAKIVSDEASESIDDNKMDTSEQMMDANQENGGLTTNQFMNNPSDVKFISDMENSEGITALQGKSTNWQDTNANDVSTKNKSVLIENGSVSNNMNANNNTQLPPVPPKPAKSAPKQLDDAPGPQPEYTLPPPPLPEGPGEMQEFFNSPQILFPDDIIDCLPEVEEMSNGMHPSPPSLMASPEQTAPESQEQVESGTPLSAPLATADEQEIKLHEDTSNKEDNTGGEMIDTKENKSDTTEVTEGVVDDTLLPASPAAPAEDADEKEDKTDGELIEKSEDGSIAKDIISSEHNVIHHAIYDSQIESDVKEELLNSSINAPINEDAETPKVTEKPVEICDSTEIKDEEKEGSESAQVQDDVKQEQWNDCQDNNMRDESLSIPCLTTTASSSSAEIGMTQIPLSPISEEPRSPAMTDDHLDLSNTSLSSSSHQMPIPASPSSSPEKMEEPEVAGSASDEITAVATASIAFGVGCTEFTEGNEAQIGKENHVENEVENQQDGIAEAPPPRPQQIAPPLPPSSQNGPSQNDRLYNQQHQQDTNRRSGGLDNNSMPATRPSPPEPPGPPAVSRPPPAAPPAPPQPPAAPAAPPVPAPPAPPAAPAAPPVPAVPAAPPAPPAPPVAGGGGPPPPPPPPIGGPAAPSGGGGGGSGGGSGGGGTAGGLAAALAGAKLKKVVRTENNDGGGGGSSRPPPAGGGGGGDFMSSLQQKLNKRRQASENPSSDSSIKPSGRTSPPGAPKATTKPWERKPNGVDSTTTSASPQLNRRRPSQPAVNGNGGSENSLDYEKLKQEILTEMRKELQKTKTEIIDAIKLELSRR